MRLSLRLGTLQEELTRTMTGSVGPVGPQLDELLVAVDATQGDGAVTDARRAFDLAASLPSVSPDHPSATSYLSHPVRVALRALLLQIEPDPETVGIALLHNAYEVFGLGEEDLVRGGCSDRAAEIVRVLTVNRARERDDGYLESFYRRIDEHGPLAALLRCADRLDNLLVLAVLENGEVRDRYLETSEMFVVPMAARLSNELADYLRAIIEHQRIAGFDPAAKARLDAFEATT